MNLLEIFFNYTVDIFVATTVITNHNHRNALVSKNFFKCYVFCFSYVTMNI